MGHKNNTALALLSSGLDSSIALPLALKQGRDVRLALSFDYGQRAAPREMEKAKEIAAHFGIRHQVISLPWFKDFHATGLLSAHQKLPNPTQAQLNETEYSSQSAAQVWVPNRNGVMIEVAAGIAEDLNLQAVIVGFNREEAATFPDNSLAYMNALTAALAYSTKNHVEVISPTVGMDKSEIVGHAKVLHFPFELLWSCYENQARMCGVCESCMRLKRALAKNEMGWESYFENG